MKYENTYGFTKEMVLLERFQNPIIPFKFIGRNLMT